MNLKYMLKVARSCKTRSHLTTWHDWCYKVIYNNKLGMFERLDVIHDIDDEYEMMLQYVKQWERVYGQETSN